MRVGIRSALAASLGLAAFWAVTALAQNGTVARDEHQRSLYLWEYHATATSGPQRGEEIYFFKCWFCHNKYQKTGPYLKDLYKRSRLMSGDPVNDATVAAKIRKGGAAMPAYDAVLNDADMADLVSYFRDGRCCFDAEQPPRNPRYRGPSPTSMSVGARGHGPSLGGAGGVVRSVSGVALEGIMVQLISHKSAIRTTVYTNEDGRYEFPRLDAGTYTLRIARPLEFKPWVKEAVQIDGATAMPDIVLERISKTEYLPPTAEVLSQLTGSEWMLNLPGTGEEKRLFSLMCGFGCHSYYEVFRTRYDEASWRLIVKRMQQGGGSPLINMAPDNPNTVGRAGRNLMQDQEVLIKWLARIRGPETKDVPVHTLPTSRGAATRAIITEYELPRELLAPHDVHGDSKGRIWYTTHRSPWAGMLDPRTGEVKEFRIPATEAEDTREALPGTHRVWVDKKDIVWFSEQWDHYLTGLDANTGKTVARWHLPTAARINSSGFSNFAMDDNGFAYETFEESVVKIDSRNGQIVRKYPLKSFKQGTYDSIVTPDGKYWSGGPIGGGLQGLLDTESGELWEIETRTPVESPSRGGYDAVTHAFWEGCRGGMLTKLDIRTRRLTEFYPPVPYETFYEALPDKNGEIWAGGMEGGRFWRFNPKTDRWVGYMMPEPWAHDRRTWIDNSTTPVTIWYVDQNGYMVRIQPLE